MATLWVCRAHKKPKTQKWTPPSFSARKTTILVQFRPLQVFGNIIFQIGPQNSHFGGFYGLFMGPQFPNKPKTPKMDPAIVISVKNYYTGPTQPTLGIWEHHFLDWVPKQPFWRVLWPFYGSVAPKRSQKSQNGPRHLDQREKLLYWVNLAHSRYLGSSKCVLGCARAPPGELQDHLHPSVDDFPNNFFNFHQKPLGRDPNKPKNTLASWNQKIYLVSAINDLCRLHWSYCLDYTGSNLLI